MRPTIEGRISKAADDGSASSGEDTQTARRTLMVRIPSAFAEYSTKGAKGWLERIAAGGNIWQVELLVGTWFQSDKSKDMIPEVLLICVSNHVSEILLKDAGSYEDWMEKTSGLNFEQAEKLFADAGASRSSAIALCQLIRSEDPHPSEKVSTSGIVLTLKALEAATEAKRAQIPEEYLVQAESTEHLPLHELLAERLTSSLSGAKSDWTETLDLAPTLWCPAEDEVSMIPNSITYALYDSENGITLESILPKPPSVVCD